jgi:hypothetical protein
MSSHQSSAALTGALLANKGGAAPSNSVSSFFDALSSPEPVDKPAWKEPRQDTAIRPQTDQPVNIAPVGSSSESEKPRAKLSVRLDQERHLRLKLAAAHLRRSSQTIMLEALDEYLAKVAPAIGGDCACLNDEG